MNFEINKHSTLPILRMELLKDGRTEYHTFHEKIQNADIYFTMYNADTGVKKIAKKRASTELVNPPNCVGDEYYIIYQFTEKETAEAGRFIGKFTIEFLDGSGTLIVPIHESLNIHVLGDIIITDC